RGHELGLQGVELGLQSVELDEQLLTIGAGHFGDPHDGFHRRYISGGAEMLVGNLCVNGEPSRFDTMPSRPILQAWRNTLSPSWARWSFRRSPGRLYPTAPDIVCAPLPKGGSFL